MVYGGARPVNPAPVSRPRGGCTRLKFQRYECLDFESFERENTGDGAGFDVQYVAM